MQSKSIYKIPNGKLLKIFLNYNEVDNLINSIKITGDFFAYPEESIDLLEKKLRNKYLKEEQLLKLIQSIIEDNNIQFIGLNAKGLAKGIMMCVL
jgi:hypothetical protein